MTDLSDVLGKTVNVYTITETLNDWGDVTKGTSATTSIVCEIQVMTGDESIVRSGVLMPNDAIAFFKPGSTINIGDELAYQSKTWEIVGLFKEQIGDTVVF